MNFRDAFKLMKEGKILVIEDVEFRVCSAFPPSIECRPTSEDDLEWKVKYEDYFIYLLACDDWEVKNEKH